MFSKTVNVKELAGIEYHGLGGVTRQCLKAIARLIQFGDLIKKAYLLSNIDDESGCGKHCYLLITEFENHIAIKSGFSSGYGGEGPAGLSKSLQILIRHNIEVEEYAVDSDFINRLDQSCLLSSDLENLRSQRPIRPTKVSDYIRLKDDTLEYDDQQVQHIFPSIVPFSIIDIRIMDLAINLTSNPDLSLMSGFRRLEDAIRKRTDLDGSSGTKLFSRAFQGNEPILHWPDISEAESKGRVSLLTGAYMAYRNNRAHKESETNLNDAVKEFLLINQLFVMEREAVDVVNG